MPMVRAAIWLIAFSPIIVALIFGWSGGEDAAGLYTALAIVQGPLLIIAAIFEFWLLQKRGVSVSKGSPIGNKLAQILGIVFLILLIRGVYKIATNNP
jgi:hypothetical protein